jgi:tRNA(Arg) A34 adenosine deaminase TadA
MLNDPGSLGISFSLPGWAREFISAPRTPQDDFERMRFVLRLAQRNVDEGAGGPFAAAVFERDGGRLIALGLNLVESRGLSVLHAEIVALSLAQRVLGAYDLSRPGLPTCLLVSSAEPCAMCLGALPWSGVRGLVVGARGEDVEAAGFDEGAKPADWVGELARRGVATVRDVERPLAAALIRDYVRRGGAIYNPASSRLRSE